MKSQKIITKPCDPHNAPKIALNQAAGLKGPTAKISSPVRTCQCIYGSIVDIDKS